MESSPRISRLIRERCVGYFGDLAVGGGKSHIVQRRVHPQRPPVTPEGGPPSKI